MTNGHYPHTLTTREHDHLPTCTHQKGTWPLIHTHSPEGNKHESWHSDKTVESSTSNIKPKWSQKRGHLWQGVYVDGNRKERFEKTVVWKEGWPLLQASLIGGFTVMRSILKPPRWSRSLINRGYKSRKEMAINTVVKCRKEMTINTVVMNRALKLEGRSTDTHCW